MLFDAEAKDLIKKLCHPNLDQRLCSAADIKLQTYFTAPWAAVTERRLIPPYIPTLKEIGDSHCFSRYEDIAVRIEEGEGMGDGRFADF